MRNTAGSNPVLTHCIFTGNSASNGGAMSNGSSGPAIINCLFTLNAAVSHGGAVTNDESTTTFINCTIYGNSGPSGGGVASYDYSEVTITNTILWANSPNQVYNDDPACNRILYSCVEGGWSGAGNIEGAPLFADPDGPDDVLGTEDDDFSLTARSACSDAGDNSVVPPTLLTDLAGLARFADDLQTPDTGSGTPPIIDMGAYEYQGGILEEGVIYVDDDAAGANNGSSWANAFNYLQDALEVAESGDEIRVAQGTYKPDRGAGITPYDWSKENYSEEWWLAEGGTSFFDELILLRAGFRDADEYVSGLGRDIEQDRQRPGNTRQSVTESSFDAWIGLWRGNQNSYNDESNYYGKGKLATMLLNLEIIKLSAGETSLQDVMKAMFERIPVFEKGYTVRDLQDVCEEFAGGPMDGFFSDFIYGAKAYPWEDALAVAGLQVTANGDDPKPVLGVGMIDGDDGVRIRTVVEGSAAFKAGIDPGDVIVALNGYKVGSSDINARIGEAKVGERMSLTLFRNGMLRTIDVTLTPDPVPSYTVERVENPTDAQKRAYEKWLGLGWPE